MRTIRLCWAWKGLWVVGLAWLLVALRAQTAQAQSCDELIDAFQLALNPAECKQINENYACYGHTDAVGVPADLFSEMDFLFMQPGHHLPISNFATIDTLGPEGTVVMLLRTQDDPVYFVLFGNAQIGSFIPDTQQMSGMATSDEPICDDTPAALVVHTHNGESGFVTVNGVEIELSSTALITLRGYEASSTGGGTGRMLYYSELDGDWEIYTMDVDGRNRLQLTANGAHDYHAKWSPDGRQIVFQSNRAGNYKLFVMDENGRNVGQLTFDGPGMAVNDSHPDWSPDGREIVFVRETREGSVLYALDTESGDLRLIQPYGENGEIQGLMRWPVWSPDNERIAFASNADGDWEIYVMDWDGVNARQLTRNDYDDINPAWSPDGSRIAFGARPEDHYQIHVVDHLGVDERVLTQPTSGGDWAPIWSPDGRKISFVSSADGDNDIMVMDSNGLNVQRLTRNRVRDEVALWQPNVEPAVYDMVVANLDGQVAVDAIALDEGEQMNITMVNELPTEFSGPEPSPYMESDALRWLVDDPAGIQAVELPVCGGPLALGQPRVESIGAPGQECVYTFRGQAGQNVSIAMRPAGSDIGATHLPEAAGGWMPVAYVPAPLEQRTPRAFDPWLDLRGPDEELLASDDNGLGDGLGSLIRGYVLPRDGTYSIVARTRDKQGVGRFEVTLESGAAREPVCLVVTDRLNVRPGPGTEYGSPLTAVPEGERLLPRGRNSAATWVQVQLASGLTGWVNASSQYVECNFDIGTLPVVPVTAPATATPRPVVTPPATATPRLTPTPITPTGADIRYLPPAEIIVAGDCQACAEFSWDVRNINAIYLNEYGVNGQGSTSVCLPAGDRSELLAGMWGAITYPYQFRILSNAGETSHTTDVVFTYPLVQFWTDDTSISPGACTTLRWNVSGAQAVYLQGDSVNAAGSTSACLYESETYRLDVAGQCLTTQYYVTVDVAYAAQPDLITSVNDLDVSCESTSSGVACYTDIYFTVSNIGSGASSAFYVGAFAEEVPEDYVLVEGLGPGASQSLSVRLGPGGNCYNPDCSVSVWADYFGDVPESNEGNNGSERFEQG